MVLRVKDCGYEGGGGRGRLLHTELCISKGRLVHKTFLDDSTRKWCLWSFWYFELPNETFFPSDYWEGKTFISPGEVQLNCWRAKDLTGTASLEPKVLGLA